MGTARRKRTPDVRGLVWEVYVLCWSGFPLQGVHRFESPRLSDMSNRLFVAVITQIITEHDGLMVITGIMIVVYYNYLFASLA
jgi:hypothetical protein